MLREANSVQEMYSW